MATGAWLQLGNVAMKAGGTVWICDHCPCGPTRLTCCPGTTFPGTRHLTVTSADPSNCPCLVGTFLMTLTPGTARYLSDPIPCLGYHTGRWGIICSNDALASTRWHLFFICDDSPGAVVVATWNDGDPWCSTYVVSGSGNGPMDVSGNNGDCCVGGSYLNNINFDFAVSA